MAIEGSTGQAVLACAVAFEGRAPTVRSLTARAPGRLTSANAGYWIERWKGCLAPPPDAAQRAQRLGRDLQRYLYQSATISRRGRISRQGLAEHRDALMCIAWGLSTYSPAFVERDTEYRTRGMTAIQARVALARHACRLTYRLLKTQQPFD